MSTENVWTFRNVRHGADRSATLEYYWEVDGDPVSDDFVPEDASAVELLRIWANRYHPQGGDARIHWYVKGESIFEAAPFSSTLLDQDFLTHFTWPTNAKTGVRLNWLSLPVVDKAWRGEVGDKGGFIQEATGWKPSPLVPTVNIGLLLGGTPD